MLHCRMANLQKKARRHVLKSVKVRHAVFSLFRFYLNVKLLKRANNADCSFLWSLLLFFALLYRVRAPLSPSSSAFEWKRQTSRSFQKETNEYVFEPNDIVRSGSSPTSRCLITATMYTTMLSESDKSEFTFQCQLSFELWPHDLKMQIPFHVNFLVRFDLNTAH